MVNICAKTIHQLKLLLGFNVNEMIRNHCQWQNKLSFVFFPINGIKSFYIYLLLRKKTNINFQPINIYLAQLDNKTHAFIIIINLVYQIKTIKTRWFTRPVEWSSASHRLQVQYWFTRTFWQFRILRLSAFSLVQLSQWKCFSFW